MTTMTPTKAAEDISVNAPKTGIARTAFPTAALAVAINTSIFGLARLGGVDFAPTGSSHKATVTVAAVLATTVIAMAIGWALVAFTVRRRRPTLGTVSMIGIVFASLSTLVPLTLNLGVSARLTLVSLHLVAGSLYVIGIARLRRTSAGETR
ncbi:MAG: DUF6069 family protein [Acidimicrobiales bacterium]